MKILNQLSKTFPGCAAAYHTSVMNREMEKYPMCITPDGFKFSGNSNMQTGKFEPEETSLLRNLAPSIDMFIDVGANVGYFVCLMRALEKHVIAIEPLNQNLRYLYRNVKENKWSDVEVYPVGLSDQPNIIDIYGGGTGASLIPHWSGVSNVVRTTIPVNTLDNILGARFSDQRLFIKIDVEGLEYQVLKGSTRTLTMLPAPRWLIEINLTEHHPSSINPNFINSFELMFEEGYEAFTVEGGRQPVNIQDVKRWFTTKKRDFGGINYLFEKK
jgi:FkbM family methyltransferase